MGLVSSNKSWANFSNRSDSNYTRDNCCIFDVYTTSRKFNIRNSDERLNAIRFLSPRRCWLDNTSNPPEIRTFYLSFQYPYRSIFQPIDFLEDLIRGGRLNRPRDPKFSAHRSKRSVFLFLFFFTDETQVGNASSLRFFVDERRDNLSLFLLLVEWKIVESTKRGKKGPLFAQGHAQQSGTDLSRKLLCLGHLNANLVTLHSPGYNGVKGGKKGLVL